MKITISEYSNLFGLTYKNLQLPAMQRFLRRQGYTISFVGRDAILQSQKAGFFNSHFQEQVQKIELAAQKQASSPVINVERANIIRKLQEFSSNNIHMIFSLYLRQAKPRYDEESSSVQFNVKAGKWVHNATSPIWGRLVALYRNIIDYFSLRRAKIQLAKEIIESESRPAPVSEGEAFNLLENKTTVIRQALIKNHSLDSEGGRLDSLLKYSMFVRGNMSETTLREEEQLVNDVVSSIYTP